MHTGLARFQSSDFSHDVRTARISASRYRHLAWKRCAFIQPHRRATFKVRTNQQRQFGFGLQLIIQDRRRISLALFDSQRSDARNQKKSTGMKIAHVVHHLLVCGRVGCGKCSVIRREKQLTDFFVNCHLPQRAIHPLPLSGGQGAQRPSGFASWRRLCLFCRRGGAALTS